MDTNTAVALVVVAIIVLVVYIATMLIVRINRKRVDAMKIRYITPLENSDHSIQNAMKYLKRTNNLRNNFKSNN